MELESSSNSWNASNQSVKPYLSRFSIKCLLNHMIENWLDNAVVHLVNGFRVWAIRIKSARVTKSPEVVGAFFI